MKKWTWVLLVAALVVAPAAAQDDENLADPLDHAPNEVLVKFKDKTPPAGVLDAARGVGAQHLRSFPGIGVRHWKLGKAVSVEKAVEILSKRKDVEYAEPNYLVRAHGNPDDPRFADLWGLQNVGQTGGVADADIDAPEAWDVRTDAPAVVVGVIDTGIDYNHEDLAGNIWTNPGEVPDNGIDDDANGYVDDVRGWDFVNGDNDPMDDNGHGSHTAGTVGAIGNNGVGVAGVCWSVKLMPLKFLNAGGSGSTANAILAVQYAASFEDGAGNKIVRVTSNSWGGGRRSKSLENAIAAAGALFVASAGNSGSSQKAYPAGYSIPEVVSVAATDHDDALAPFSNYGPDWVHLAAPGVAILSTIRSNGYGTKSGTSMSAPHVAGAAALVLAQTGGSNAQVKEALLGGVDPLPALSGLVLSGGRLNVLRALGGTPPPTVDTTPPAAVSDLAIDASATTWDSVKLLWTATGDDGSAGQAAAYDVRYLAGQALTDANWDTATKAGGEPLPQPAGMAESLTVPNLAPETTYFFGLKVFDEAGNVSPLSNVASATTPPAPTGDWVVEHVVTDNVGSHRGLAYDASGNPAIAYSGGNWDVRFTYKSGGVWQNELADTDAPYSGPGIDLAFAPDGAPTISYGQGGLIFARRSGGSWTIETVDRWADNDCTSLAYDPATGEPTISYRGSSHGKEVRGLRFVRKTGGSWQTQLVEAAGARYSSLAYDPEGNPSIAYSDDANGDNWLDTLKFARWNGSSWQIQVVETGSVGYGVFCSLSYGPDGHPAIVHRASDVRFLFWDGSSWQLEIVDTGTNTSLKHDGAGVPHIAYTDAGKLMHAWRDPASGWQTELVDPQAANGARTDLAFDGNGKPAICYRPGVKLAHK